MGVQPGSSEKRRIGRLMAPVVSRTQGSARSSTPRSGRLLTGTRFFSTTFEVRRVYEHPVDGPVLLPVLYAVPDSVEVEP